MAKIPGGYLLMARKIIDSDLMLRPAHYMKLWVWMLSKASWSDGHSLKRGQLLTSIAEMQEAGGHMVGYRKKCLTKDETRSAYEALTKATMITTTKTTRGMVVTILNYDTYQDSKNYEAHNETHNETQAKPYPTPQDSKEGLKKKNINPCPFDDGFDQFWKVYPRKTAKTAAVKAWAKHHPPIEKVLKTLSWQISSDDWKKDSGKFIPHPATWLNAGRWEDEAPAVRAEEVAAYYAR